MNYVFKCLAFVDHPYRCSFTQRNGTLLCCHSCTKYESCDERCKNMVHKCGKNTVEKASTRNSQSGKPGRNGRKVVQYDLKGNKIAEYPSIKAASSASGISQSCICTSARGKSNTSGQYIWRYKEERRGENEY